MKYFLTVLGVVLLIIFGIVIFNRDNSKIVTPPGKNPINLMDYAKNTSAYVQYSTEGAINALENHRTTQITVSPNSRNITTLTGYQGQVHKSQDYSNDVDAYTAFLAALSRAAFTRERRLGSNISPTSICPTASRTHYKIMEGDKEVMNLWTATCASGSFGGNVSLTNTLFQAQIPNYNSFMSSN